MTTVRICVCGDAGVGKSSLIACFVKDTFISGKIQAVLPQVTIPPTIAAPEENVTTLVVDTSPLPQQREALNQEIRKANVILLVYAAPDHYSYERLGLFWLPHFRSLGVNVPVVLCAAKSDLVTGNQDPTQIFEDEVLPLMSEFKEVDTCVRASSRERHNVNETFYLCQKAVVHPISPLYDSKELVLKPAAVQALKRIFWLADKDKDGLLNDKELQAFQARCFGKSLEPEDISSVKEMIRSILPEAVSEQGITEAGFLVLHKFFAEKGRHETVWIVLRAYHYTDSVNLKESFLHPKFDVPPTASAELSPAGYQFLFDLFLLFDKDNDGGLNNTELAALFYPTPGFPNSWDDFPTSTVRNEAGYITLQGWLAQWSMTTFTSPRTTLEYLAYLGFEPADSRHTTATALKVTKPLNRRRQLARVDRNVVHAYLVGAPGAGKSSLLNAFLAQPFTSTYHPTIRPRVAVNSVELPGGKQCYLILEELGELENAVLENKTRLEACDLVLYAYDSSDPDSFGHVLRLREKHSHLKELPAMFIALKADLDRTNQRSEVQPDEYCAALGVAKPLHVSVAWKSVGELFVPVAETALRPAEALPKKEKGKGGDGEWMSTMLAVGAAVAVGAAGVAIWRRVRND